MKKRKIISAKNQRTKFPVWQSLIMLLMFENYQISEYVQGVIIFIYALVWIIAFCDLFMIKPVDIFEEK